MPLQVRQILCALNEDPEDQLARGRSDAGRNKDLRSRSLPALGIHMCESTEWDSILRTVAIRPHD